MTLLDSIFPISIPKIGMKYWALNIFLFKTQHDSMKYIPHATLHRKPMDIGISNILRFSCVRANAVCEATSIMITIEN